MTIGALVHSLTHSHTWKVPCETEGMKENRHHSRATHCCDVKKEKREKTALARSQNPARPTPTNQPTNNQTQIRSFHFSIVGRNCKTQFLRCAYLAVLVFHLSFLVQINLYCCLAVQPLEHEHSEMERSCIRNRIEYNPHK